MSRPTLVTEPAEAPVTLAQFKQHARVDSGDDDAIAQVYLDAAVSHLDGWGGVLGRCLVTQTWRQAYADWCEIMRLPFPDVASVTVRYYDQAAAQQTVAASMYEILEDARGCYIAFKDAFTDPALDDDRELPIEIDMVTGYGGASSVPVGLRAAILMLGAHLYENREAVVASDFQALPLGLQYLIAPHRRVGV